MKTQYSTATAPVTLGVGAPLLPRRITSSRLSLLGVDHDDQFVHLTYRVGAPDRGTAT